MLVFMSLILPIFCLTFSHLGLESSVFCVRGVAKSNFQRNWNSDDFELHFLCCLVSKGIFFMNFGAMETGLKFHRFSGLPQETPKLRERASGTLALRLTGLYS